MTGDVREWKRTIIWLMGWSLCESDRRMEKGWYSWYHWSKEEFGQASRRRIHRYRASRVSLTAEFPFPTCLYSYRICRSIYKSCNYITNMCVHADSQANKAMAVSSLLGRHTRSALISSFRIVADCHSSRSKPQGTRRGERSCSRYRRFSNSVPGSIHSWRYLKGDKCGWKESWTQAFRSE